jgi:hypothetical protein
MPMTELLRAFEFIKSHRDFFERMMALNIFLTKNFGENIPLWNKARDLYVQYETTGKITGAL